MITKIREEMEEKVELRKNYSELLKQINLKQKEFNLVQRELSQLKQIKDGVYKQIQNTRYKMNIPSLAKFKSISKEEWE